MIGETGERKSAVATPDGKSRNKKKKKCISMFKWAAAVYYAFGVCSSDVFHQHRSAHLLLMPDVIRARLCL